MNIYINVVNQTLHITSSTEYIVEGSQNFVRFRFGLDESWGTLTTFAQFAQNGVAYNVYLDEDNCVYLPSEIRGGKCTLMLYGTGRGNVIATTNYLTLTINGSIMVTDAQSTDITPSLYAQLVEQVVQAQADLNVLSARVDLLTSLPSGSTSGDAELMDIRVGADGVTYQSAGSAVRANIQKKLDALQDEADEGKALIVGANGLVAPAMFDPEKAHMLNYTSIFPINSAPIPDINPQTDTLMNAIRKLRAIMRWDMVPSKQALDDYSNTGDTSAVVATDTINDAFAKLQAQSSRIENLLAVSDYTPTWTIGSYINGAGNVSSSTAGEMSNRIILNAGDTIVVTWSAGTATGIGAIAKYNENASYTLLASNEYNANKTSFMYSCTEDSTSVVLSALKTTTVTVQIFGLSAIYLDASHIHGISDALPIPWEYSLDEILCIGDSLTYGVPADIGSSDPTMPVPMRQNYPYYLGRMLNANVTNAGFSGDTTEVWFKRRYSNYTMSDYNAAIIFLGTNGNLTDTLDEDVNQYNDYNDYAQTNTGFYCRLIESIMHDNANCSIVLVNVWSVSNPMSVTDTTRDVIRQIGAKYGLPVVETYDLRYAVNPIYHGNFNNVHMTKAGYLALANRICTTLRSYYNTHRSALNVGMTS